MRGGENMNDEQTKRGILLSRRLVSDGPRIVFTGRSLDMLIELFWNQLESSEDPGSLLDRWENTLPLFRERLITRARDLRSIAIIGPEGEGHQVPLISEDVARGAPGLCFPGL